MRIKNIAGFTLYIGSISNNGVVLPPEGECEITQSEYQSSTIQNLLPDKISIINYGSNPDRYVLYEEGLPSSKISYDNTESGLEATNAQDAIDELSEGRPASSVTYDNQASTLSATNVQDAVDELDAKFNLKSMQQTTLELIGVFQEKVPDVILETTGANDLQVAITALSVGQVLGVKTNAQYNPITINKNISIKAIEGYTPSITGAGCIRMMDGVSGCIISGFLLHNATQFGSANEAGCWITFGEKHAIISNVIFHNITMDAIQSSPGIGICLAYHWSDGQGDTYDTPSTLEEMSTNIAFVGCRCYAGGNYDVEGANIVLRGMNKCLIQDCFIDNGGLIGRGINLNNCVNLLISGNTVRNIGGVYPGDNVEAIKIDRMGGTGNTIINTVIVEFNKIDSCNEGIDIDDFCEAIVRNNIVTNARKSGIQLDNDSRAFIVNNICYNGLNGIWVESGAICSLHNNNCFQNIENYKMDNGYTPDASNASTNVLDAPYVPTTKENWNSIPKTVSEALDTIVDVNTKFTPEGGFAIKLLNKTGTDSVKGTLVKCGRDIANSCEITRSEDISPIGSIYEDRVADGSPVWVVVGGIAEVLLKDGDESTVGYWVYTSDREGRVSTMEVPTDEKLHFREVGHSLENCLGGTDVLIKIVMHFN